MKYFYVTGNWSQSETEHFVVKADSVKDAVTITEIKYPGLRYVSAREIKALNL